MPDRLLDDLLNDFNDISVEARTSRNAGITGQISGLFASSQHRDVKEKAEAAQVALRGVSGAKDVPAACRACPVLFPLEDTAALLSSSSEVHVLYSMLNVCATTGLYGHWHCSGGARNESLNEKVTTLRAIVQRGIY
jgi:hypothetical protein